MRVESWAWGCPKGQPRPRAFARKVGNRAIARVYDAGTAENWKSIVVQAMREKRPESPLEGPVYVHLYFLMPRPQRLMRKKDPEGEVFHTAKPDIDNLQKAVLDALTQDGWWGDDSQVVSIEATKKYHAKDGRPGAHIIIGDGE